MLEGRRVSILALKDRTVDETMSRFKRNTMVITCTKDTLLEQELHSEEKTTWKLTSSKRRIINKNPEVSLKIEG